MILEFLLVLLVAITGAKLGGLASNRLGQPAVVGELLVGLILGPTVLDLLHLPLFSSEHLGETIHLLAELGVVFLMFVAGLEIELEEMASAGRVAVLAGILGVVVPLILGAITALPFGYSPIKSLFIGVILTATSVSISAQTLMELGVLRSREGIALLGAAVVDDVLVILILSLFVALADGSGGLIDVVWVVVKMVVYLGAAAVLGVRLIPAFTRWIDRVPVSEGLLAGAIVAMLAFAWSAEALGGVALITGAFIAGVLFARTPLRDRIEIKMHAVAYAFFVPIFFVSIGLQANARLIGGGSLVFATLIVIVAIVSKVIGSGWGAHLAGFDSQASLRLGTGMISRGEVGLIVATVGLDNGFISDEVFAITVVMVLATTLITPLLLRQMFAGQPGVMHAPQPAREVE
ncbi:MAG: hypothetical protein A2Z04_08400 [Chloroflexi bacterium RBG_16_57_9]|nr:MAG: hypothetical protein A2Z04_08400 [Chloroflexi bacterium RBG_16_57_9]